VLVFPPVKKLKAKLDNLQSQITLLQSQITLVDKMTKTYYEDKCKTNKIYPDDYLLDFIIKAHGITSLGSAINYYITDGKDSALKLKLLCEEFLPPPPPPPHTPPPTITAHSTG
jgi:hypothetical protein